MGTMSSPMSVTNTTEFTLAPKMGMWEGCDGKSHPTYIWQSSDYNLQAYRCTCKESLAAGSESQTTQASPDTFSLTIVKCRYWKLERNV